MTIDEFEDLAKKYDCMVMHDFDLDGMYFYLYAPKLADYRIATYYSKFQSSEMFTNNGKQQFIEIEDLESNLITKLKQLKEKRIEKKLHDLEKDFE